MLRRDIESHFVQADGAVRDSDKQSEVMVTLHFE